jgi:hypothetical protein
MRWFATFLFVLVFLLTGCGPREPVPSRTYRGAGDALRGSSSTSIRTRSGPLVKSP